MLSVPPGVRHPITRSGLTSPPRTKSTLWKAPPGLSTAVPTPSLCTATITTTAPRAGGQFNRNKLAWVSAWKTDWDFISIMRHEMSKLSIFELFPCVQNLMPKLKWFFKPKTFLMKWFPESWSVSTASLRSSPTPPHPRSTRWGRGIEMTEASVKYVPSFSGKVSFQKYQKNLMLGCVIP